LFNKYVYLYDQFADGGASKQLGLGCMKMNKFRMDFIENLFLESVEAIKWENLEKLSKFYYEIIDTYFKDTNHLNFAAVIKYCF